jgi:hypothetical protein
MERRNTGAGRVDPPRSPSGFAIVCAYFPREQSRFDVS